MCVNGGEGQQEQMQYDNHDRDETQLVYPVHKDVNEEQLMQQICGDLR